MSSSGESKTCRVTISDREGVDHTAQVTAKSLYEAVARGIVAVQAHSWSEELNESDVRVTILEASVEHSVNLRKFRAWLSRPGFPQNCIYPRDGEREFGEDGLISSLVERAPNDIKRDPDLSPR
jgi:hypothetical protein